jgi:hypothetical protein
MELAILIYIVMVAGSVLYYKALSKHLYKKNRCFFTEGHRFKSHRIFYRFLMCPVDYIRLTYKWLRISRMDEMEYFTYHTRNSDKEMYEKLQILKDLKKKSLSKKKVG